MKRAAMELFVATYANRCRPALLLEMAFRSRGSLKSFPQGGTMGRARNVDMNAVQSVVISSAGLDRCRCYRHFGAKSRSPGVAETPRGTGDYP